MGELTLMEFGDVLNRLDRSHPGKYARKGWNGKGLFIAAQYPDEHSKMGNPYLYIDATALGGTLNPWVPSQTDLFANDWYEVTEETK
jgi:hypothetical protein